MRDSCGVFLMKAYCSLTGHLASGTSTQLLAARQTSLRFLASQIQAMTGVTPDLVGMTSDLELGKLRATGSKQQLPVVVADEDNFGIIPFFVPKGE